MKKILDALNVNPKLIVLYVLIYYTWGFLMNEIGIYLEIARFTYRIQILICYVFFMIPVSLILRKLPWHQQYAYGCVIMGLYEFGGYAFETSYAYPGNLMDQVFNERNFSLAMTLFFGAYFPLGNGLVSKIAKGLNVPLS